MDTHSTDLGSKVIYSYIASTKPDTGVKINKSTTHEGPPGEGRGRGGKESPFKLRWVIRGQRTNTPPFFFFFFLHLLLNKKNSD